MNNNSGNNSIDLNRDANEQVPVNTPASTPTQTQTQTLPFLNKAPPSLTDYVNANKQIILIDMDNTIVDYSSSMAKSLNTTYNRTDITPDNWHLLGLNDLHYNRSRYRFIR